MRDLKADLEICNKATPGPWGKTQSEGDCSGWNCPRNMEVCDEDCPMCEEYELYKGAWLEGPDYIEIGDYSYFTDKDAEFIAEAREGWPEAIARAIKAEAEVERLKTDMIDYRRGATYMTKQIQSLRAELAQLRKVADAARALVPNEMYQCTRHLYALKHTLDEYDKAKEGQE
jgi:hypothetical protein